MKHKNHIFICLIIVLIFIFRYESIKNQYFYNQLSVNILALISRQNTQDSDSKLNQIESFLSNLDIKSEPDERRNAWFRGYYYHLLEQPTKAQDAWRIASPSPSFFVWQGEQARLQKEYEEALNWLNYGASTYPELSVYPYYIGLLNEDRLQWDMAIDAYEKANKLDSFQNMSKSHLNYRLAINYHRRDGFQELQHAYDAYNRAINANDFSSSFDLADAHYGRGDVTNYLGKSVNDSIQDFERAIAYNPHHEWAHLALGRTLLEIDGEKPDIEEHLLFALDNWTNESTLYLPLLSLGDYYCKFGREDLGIDTYQSAYSLKNEPITIETLEKNCEAISTR